MVRENLCAYDLKVRSPYTKPTFSDCSQVNKAVGYTVAATAEGEDRKVEVVWSDRSDRHYINDCNFYNPGDTTRIIMPQFLQKLALE